MKLLDVEYCITAYCSCSGRGQVLSASLMPVNNCLSARSLALPLIDGQDGAASVQCSPLSFLWHEAAHIGLLEGRSRCMPDPFQRVLSEVGQMVSLVLVTTLASTYSSEGNKRKQLFGLFVSWKGNLKSVLSGRFLMVPPCHEIINPSVTCLASFWLWCLWHLTPVRCSWTSAVFPVFSCLALTCECWTFWMGKWLHCLAAVNSLGQKYCPDLHRKTIHVEITFCTHGCELNIENNSEYIFCFETGFLQWNAGVANSSSPWERKKIQQQTEHETDSYQSNKAAQ